MKKIFVALTFTLLLFFSFTMSTKAAEGCVIFQAIPGSGNATQNFSVSGLGCGNTETTMTIKVYANFLLNNALVREITVEQNSSGRILKSLGSFARAGRYTAVLVDINNVEVNSDSFIVINSVLACNDIKPSWSTDRCPANCPETEEESLGTTIIRCKIPSDPVAWCGTEENPGAMTALGCIPFNTIKLAAKSNAFFLGISGAIALILLARAAYIMMTSEGNPASLAEAKESVTAVITGVLMLILAVFILRLLGSGFLGLF